MVCKTTFTLISTKYAAPYLELIPQRRHRVLRRNPPLSQQKSTRKLNLHPSNPYKNLLLPASEGTPIPVHLVYIAYYKAIAHRDIKPCNILVNPHTNRVVICDFGSAKQLIKSTINNMQTKLTSPTYARDVTGPQS